MATRSRGRLSGRRFDLSDLDVKPMADQAQTMVFEPAAETQQRTTLATDQIVEGEVGRYARRPDNRDTVAHYTNFGNRATHANPDLRATGVVRGAEVGEVKAAARKPQKFTMAPSGVASMMDSGIGAGPTPNLDLHIQMIVKQMMEQNKPTDGAPEPASG